MPVTAPDVFGNTSVGVGVWPTVWFGAAPERVVVGAGVVRAEAGVTAAPLRAVVFAGAAVLRAVVLRAVVLAGAALRGVAFAGVAPPVVDGASGAARVAFAGSGVAAAADGPGITDARRVSAACGALLSVGSGVVVSG